MAVGGSNTPRWGFPQRVPRANASQPRTPNIPALAKGAYRVLGQARSPPTATLTIGKQRGVPYWKSSETIRNLEPKLEKKGIVCPFSRGEEKVNREVGGGGSNTVTPNNHVNNRKTTSCPLLEVFRNRQKPLAKAGEKRHSSTLFKGE